MPVPRTSLSISALVVIACGAGCADSDQRTAAAATDEGPVVTLRYEANAWPAAIVEGELTERSGCLLIGDAIALFPKATTWDPPWVRFSRGEAFEVGSHVRMGGGYGEVQELTQPGSPIVPVARVRACASATGATQYAWASPQGG